MSKLIWKMDFIKDKGHIANSLEYNEEKAEHFFKDLRNVIDQEEHYHIANSLNYNVAKSSSLINQDGYIDIEAEMDTMLMTESNIYRGILSIKTEDAIAKSLINLEDWNKLMRKHIPNIALKSRIPLENMKWNIALHLDQEHHPHIHMHFWNVDSKDTNTFVTAKAIEKIQKAFIKDVFAEEIKENIYKQNEITNEIKERLNFKSIDNTYSYSTNKYGYLNLGEKIKINNKLKNYINKDKELAELFDKLINTQLEYKLFFGIGEYKIKEKADKLLLSAKEKEEYIITKTKELKQKEKKDIKLLLLEPTKNDKTVFHNLLLKKNNEILNIPDDIIQHLADYHESTNIKDISKNELYIPDDVIKLLSAQHNQMVDINKKIIEDVMQIPDDVVKLLDLQHNQMIDIDKKIIEEAMQIPDDVVGILVENHNKIADIDKQCTKKMSNKISNNIFNIVDDFIQTINTNEIGMKSNEQNLSKRLPKRRRNKVKYRKKKTIHKNYAMER